MNGTVQVISVHFDGGCRPTNPGHKYGSYEMLLDGESIRSELEFELGWGTCNEAEFESLDRGLDWALGSLQDYGYDPQRYRLELFTDSTIVRNRINGSYRRCNSEPAQRMARLASRCLEKLRLFHSFSIEWKPRECNVERFGH